MRKKIIPILLSFSLFLNQLWAQETENPTAILLREALFAEQADRDLAKAEKGYREIIKKFEDDRAYAATAILRLAEILHQRGDTAEAEKWFARVLQEFLDQEAIAKVATARLGEKADELLGERPTRIDPQTEEIKRISELLEQSPDLLNSQIRGSNFLATAAAKGQLEVIEFLLGKGARVDLGQSSSSALAKAVYNGHLSVVERLLKAGAKLEHGLLIEAVRDGNYAISKRLLQAGANPNIKSSIGLSAQEIKDFSSFSSKSNEFSEPADPFGDLQISDRTPEDVSDQAPSGVSSWTPLETAVFYRFSKLIDLLLENGAKSQKENDEYPEDLRFAIVDQNTKLVAKLLKIDADPNSIWHSRSGGLSALSIASKFGNSEITKLLIDAGADVNIAEPRYKNTPLFYANGDTVGLLLDAGADPNAKNYEGETPLHGVWNPKKAKALLAGGAKLDAVNDDGYSPIVRADLRVLDVLLAAKPDLSKPEGDSTALGLASGKARSYSETERIEKLIAAGADPNQVDKSGMTPLMIAVANRNAKGVKALIAGGAKPGGVSPSSPPLSLLTSNSAEGEIIRALVEAGADPNVLDQNNVTVLAKVAKNNDLKTARFLLEKGAELEVAGKFAFIAAPDKSETKSELFLATYQQPDRRRGTIRVVTPKLGLIDEEVAAFVVDSQDLPDCPYSLLEAYANCKANLFSFGDVTIWRAGKEEPMKFNLRKIIASADPAKDPKLAWGDLVQFSRARSEIEIAVSEAEKNFLDEYLNREVNFTLDGKTNKVAMGLDWAKLSNSENWIRKDPFEGDREIFLIYSQTTNRLPLIPTNKLDLWVPIEGSGGALMTAEHQHLKRSGRKIGLLPNQKSNLWLEPGDAISLKVNRPGSPSIPGSPPSLKLPE